MLPCDGIRLGIVGAGAVALDHAAVAESLGARVVAASTRSTNSPRWAAFSAAHPGCAFEPDPAAMADRADVDAMVLCLPWKAQVDWLDWGLAARKPVLIEKPIALESDPLRKALTRHAATVPGKLVGYNRRFYRTVARMAGRLAQGGLRAADVTISEEVARLVKRHGADMPAYSMEHSGCHLIDLMAHLFGALSIVHMTRSHEMHDGVVFENYNGLLETQSGVPVAFFNNANDPSRVGIRCKFDDGTAWCLTPPEILTVYDGYDIIERSAEIQVRQYAPRVAERVVEDASFRPGFKAQMQAFLTGDAGPGCTVAMALETLDLIGAIRSEARDIRL